MNGARKGATPGTPTLDEVARVAGVSRATASRAMAVASFTDDFEALDGHVRWDVMKLKYWTDVPAGADLRAAELLVHGQVPWELVNRVGVKTNATRTRVREILEGKAHQPSVDVRPEWYF